MALTHEIRRGPDGVLDDGRHPLVDRFAGSPQLLDRGGVEQQVRVVGHDGGNVGLDGLRIEPDVGDAAGELLIIVEDQRARCLVAGVVVPARHDKSLTLGSRPSRRRRRRGCGGDQLGGGLGGGGETRSPADLEQHVDPSHHVFRPGLLLEPRGERLLGRLA